MNGGKENRSQPTGIAKTSRGLVAMERIPADSELHTAVRGSVYLIVNDLIRNRVKIGYTTRDPIERAAELVTTGTTGTFVVIYEAMVRNPYAVEQEVHRRLRAHNRGLEWFEVCPNRAKEEICAVAGQVLYEDITPRWHRTQAEPSSETKELLREAKQAADEKRRREEEDDRRARLAAEETRIKQAQQAAEAQRLADEEAYRRRAEEQAREAAIEGEHRRRREQQLRTFAEEQQKRARRSRYVWGLARRLALFSAPVWVSAFFAYLVWGPYSPQRVGAIEMQCEALAADVQSLRAALRGSADKVRLADQSRQSLAESREALPRTLADHLAKKKRVAAMLAYSQREYDEARARYGKDGRPMPGRDGLSVRTIQDELEVHTKSFQAAKQSHDEWVAKEKMLRQEIEALPARIEKAEAVAKEAARQVVALEKELDRREKSLEISQATLTRMRTHNKRFTLLRNVGTGN